MRVQKTKERNLNSCKQTNKKLSKVVYWCGDMQKVYNKPLCEAEGTTEGVLVAVGMVCFGQVSESSFLFQLFLGGRRAVSRGQQVIMTGDVAVLW